MSVIFKERHYDQLILILKRCSVIFLILIILSALFNFILKNKMELLEGQLKSLQAEKLKYKSLIKEYNSKAKNKSSKKEKYNLLVKLANYAQALSYNSIHLKDQQLRLEAESSSQNSLFKLLASLKNDEGFKEVELENIIKKANYHFQIQTLFLK